MFCQKNWLKVPPKREIMDVRIVQAARTCLEEKRRHAPARPTTPQIKPPKSTAPGSGMAAGAKATPRNAIFAAADANSEGVPLKATL